MDISWGGAVLHHSTHNTYLVTDSVLNPGGRRTRGSPGHGAQLHEVYILMGEPSTNKQTNCDLIQFPVARGALKRTWEGQRGRVCPGWGGGGCSLQNKVVFAGSSRMRGHDRRRGRLTPLAHAPLAHASLAHAQIPAPGGGGVRGNRVTGTE